MSVVSAGSAGVSPLTVQPAIVWGRSGSKVVKMIHATVCRQDGQRTDAGAPSR